MYPALTWSMFCLAAMAAGADDLPWPARNGPLGTGAARPEDARGVPTEWNESTGTNVAWKVDLEGLGHSTPVIGGGRIWFTSATADGKQQFVDCVDAETGMVLHHKLLFENAKPEPLGNAVNTYASPSCVLEPGAVYAHFGTYGTARLDSETAAVVWQRRDLHCRHFRGPGSSPVVWRDLVILTFDGIDRQFLAALDRRDGRTVWQINRSTNYHDLGPSGRPMLDGDYRKAYGTPGIVEVGGQAQLVSIGSRAFFGYDAATGKEIWTIPHKDFNAAAPPLFFENLAILLSGTGGANFLAVRLDASTRGDVSATHVAWNRTRGNARLSAPVLADEKIWFLTDNGVLYALDARTGKELAALRVGGSFVASPVIVGNRLVAGDEQGTVTVLEMSIPPRVLARNRTGEGMRASPAVARGALFLRSFGRLYKIAAR